MRGFTELEPAGRCAPIATSEWRATDGGNRQQMQKQVGKAWLVSIIGDASSKVRVPPCEHMKSPSAAPRFALLVLMLLMGRGAFAAKGDVTESEYDKKLRDAQDSAFSPWMPAKDAFEVFRRSKLDGRLLLAAEKNSNQEIRLLLFFPPDGKGGDVIYENDVSEETLLERHPIWLKQDYNVLFARKNPSGNYTALWIHSNRLGVAMKRLNEVGISAASIRVKPAQAAEATTAKAAITAPLREWRDKTGRAIQASVAGIDGGSVNFVRADGRKFAYPLADLSEADQKRLAGLQNQAAKGSDTKSAAAPEQLTDWMTRSDFETNLAEERGKGKYLVYVESSSRNEYRGLFDQLPPRVRWFQAWAEPEQGLREKHASYVAQGFALLTLSHERRTDRYCAVWVGGMEAGDVKGQRGKFGLTSPSIEEKITVSTLPKR